MLTDTFGARQELWASLLLWTVAVDVIRIVIKNPQRAAEQKRQMPPPEKGNGVVCTFAQVAGLNIGAGYHFAPIIN